MKQKYLNRRKRITLKRYQLWAADLCKEAAEAAANGNAKRLSQITKVLARKVKGHHSNTQPTIDAMRCEDEGCTNDNKAFVKLKDAAASCCALLR